MGWKRSIRQDQFDPVLDPGRLCESQTPASGGVDLRTLRNGTVG